jgi:hypothetical protein
VVGEVVAVGVECDSLLFGVQRRADLGRHHNRVAFDAFEAGSRCGGQRIVGDGRVDVWA